MFWVADLLGYDSRFLGPSDVIFWESHRPIRDLAIPVSAKARRLSRKTYLGSDVGQPAQSPAIVKVSPWQTSATQQTDDPASESIAN
jgi:hypothetical protein